MAVRGTQLACERPVPRHLQSYLRVLRVMKRARVPFLVGGSHALAQYTVIGRDSRDLDLMIRRRHWTDAAAALRADGLLVRLKFPHWLGKAYAPAPVDIIFNGGNGLTPVDDGWFDRARPARVFGQAVSICGPEELLWSKAFVMERERYDGGDVMHLLSARAGRLDWRHLVARFRGHERVLLSHVLLFGYVYPAKAPRLPPWLIPQLMRASHRDRPADRRLCRGTLLSREQYLDDVLDGTLRDGRLPPTGGMTMEEIGIWTRAIGPRLHRRGK